MRSAASDESLVSVLNTLTLQQLIIGMDEPDLLSSALVEAKLHPVDFAFLKVLKELMSGKADQHTHDMLHWCSELSGDCSFILSSLLAVGDSQMGLERDVIRASSLLQTCSLKSEHALCRLAWSSRLRIPRDMEERSASEANLDDADALLEVRHCRDCFARQPRDPLTAVGGIGTRHIANER